MRTILLILMLGLANILSAKEPTFLQYLYSAKQALPETEQVGIFITQSHYDAQKEDISKACKRTNLRAKVFVVSDMKSIGKNMKEIAGMDILLITQADVLNENASRLFILSKSKDKKIPLITSSDAYSKSGALLGLLPGEDGHSRMVLNVKHTPYLAARFTEEYNKKAGIKETIQ